MLNEHTGETDDAGDATPNFVFAVSLLAALEGAVDAEGHADALPFLGMARAELVDFGQHRPTHYVAVDVEDFGAGMAELDARLGVILASSAVLQHSLRVESVRSLLRRGMAVAGY